MFDTPTLTPHATLDAAFEAVAVGGGPAHRHADTFLRDPHVLRVLIGSHRLVWTDLRAAARQTPRATARLLGLLLAFFVLTGAGLYLIARLTVGAAMPGATLWDREFRSRAS